MIKRLRSEWTDLFSLMLVVLIVLPVAAGGGLYEFGDANFPLHVLPWGKMLPWDSTSNLGYDNVFIGLPRLLYLLWQQFCVITLRSSGISQALFYLGVFSFGLLGARKLARTCGSSPPWANLLACIAVLNPWTADRVSQGPVLVATFSLYWLMAAIIDLQRRRRTVDILNAALACTLLSCAIQVAYIAFLVGAVSAVFTVLPFSFVTIEDHRIKDLVRRAYPLALVGCASIACCGFFFLPAILDALFGGGGALTNVRTRVQYDLYHGYGAHEQIWWACTLLGFYYSKSRSEWLPQVLMVLWPIGCAVAAWLALRGKNTLTRIDPLPVFAISLCVCSLFAASVVATVPAIGRPVWEHVPGMRALVDPDYFICTYILGSIVLFGMLNPQRRFLPVGVAVVLGVAAPFAWSGGVFHDSHVPNAYRALRPAKDEGRIFWFPGLWAARYTWSPYIVSGWPALIAPSDVFGPETTEITSTYAEGYTNVLRAQMHVENQSGAAWLLKHSSTSEILVSEDLVNDPLIALPTDLVLNQNRVLSMPWHDKRRVFFAEKPRGVLFSTIELAKPLPLIGSVPSAVDGIEDNEAAEDLAIVSKSEGATYKPGQPQTSWLLSAASPTVNFQSGRKLLMGLVPGSNVQERVEVDGRISTLARATLDADPSVKEVRLLPQSAATQLPNGRSWSAGDCAATGSTTPQMASVRNGRFVGGSSFVNRCAMSSMRISEGTTTIDVPAYDDDGSANVVGVLSSGAQIAFVPQNRNGEKFLTGAVDLPRAMNLRIYLYFGPRASHVRYGAIAITNWQAKLGLIGHVSTFANGSISSADGPFLGQAFELGVPPSTKSRLIVARWSYSPGWILLGAPSQHVVVDGFANGWIVKGDLRSRGLLIVFVPALGFVLGLLCFIVLLVMRLMQTFAPLGLSQVALYP